MNDHASIGQLDIGTGYGRKPSTYLSALTEVGPGTPMGELMRRYWHPVGLASHATATPREVRVLGEDLVLFRDKTGRPGLVQARCAHRGTTLYYGKVEERGIRCCYHGWLFDVEGHCLEQPCEPEGGRLRDRVRQPWYPVQERYGLIFAYMGPPEKKPVLPRYECLEASTTASSSTPTTPASAAAATPSRRATGCSISRTCSTPITCRSCTGISAARSSPR